MALANLLRSRLALRIYLTGLAQVAVVAAGLFAILYSMRPDRGPDVFERAREVHQRVDRVKTDTGALDAELGRLSSELEVDVAVIDPKGETLASSADAAALRCPRPGPWAISVRGPVPGGPGQGFGMPPPLPLPPPPLPPEGGRDPGAMCVALPLELSNGMGTIQILGRRPTPPSLAPRLVPLVLVVVGISSLLLAWSLVRPLRRMSSAARALGAGDLSARVALRSKDELGEVARAFDDMAERVSTLLRAEKELLANVSHELRTPLARIRVALELAAEGDSSTAREALADIAEDLDELERLLADVLTAARLDLGDGPSASGLPPLRPRAVDPRDLLGSAAQRFRSMHPGRPLEVALGDELPMLEADPGLLRRLFENLLANAHKYTEEPDAPIRLLAESRGGALVVDIVDEGIGIAAGDLPFVFRPFFRSDRSRTRATGGLGLGLALAKKIAEAHGGSIVLESELGHGTRVRVTIPSAGVI